MTNTEFSGIYYITNIANNRTYVGSAININKRWNDHKRFLKNNKHKNSHLQYAWNKYGEDNFIFEIAEQTPKEQLLIIEQYYLDLAEIIPKLYYNKNYNAEAPFYGKKHSEETKRKMSESKIGNKCHLGIKHSLEVRQKMSNAKLGKSLPEFSLKHRQNISKAKLGHKYNLGKQKSNEAKAKISKAHLGMKHSQETLIKMKLTQQNRRSKE